MTPDTTDTIAAIASPPGRSGIGIVRLSGPAAKSIAELVLKLRQPLAHAAARFAHIVEPDDRSLDEAVVTYFAAPNSYTAEDVVEIAAHGSPVVLEYLMRHALAHGARLARPGEFTERAFLSGRMDLTQAEAVHDLIAAQTLVQARLAAGQLGGALARRVAPPKEMLIALIATLEAGVDFAEDDIDVLPPAAIAARIQAMEASLVPIAASYTAGRLVHDGLTLAIVGKPNAGKSSLFNRLVEHDRAIVTPIPGTTRDLVTERISLGGIPVELIDTAGLRTTSDVAEAIGIAKTREAIAGADVILAVYDVTESAHGTHEDAAWLAALEDPRTFLVANKIDLAPDNLAPDNETTAQAIRVSPPVSARVSAHVSALTGEGIEPLRESILRFVQAGSNGAETGMLTTLRHHEAITQCQSALAAARQAVEQNIPHEMLLLDLYAALAALDSLTGVTTADDILHRIFSTFCIGK